MIIGQTCVTLANLLLFSTGSPAQLAAFTHLVEMSREEGQSPFLESRAVLSDGEYRYPLLMTAIAYFDKGPRCSVCVQDNKPVVR